MLNSLTDKKDFYELLTCHLGHLCELNTSIQKSKQSFLGLFPPCPEQVDSPLEWLTNLPRVNTVDPSIANMIQTVLEFAY